MKRETVRTLKEWAFYSSSGLTVALSIFIGLFAGLYLDSRFGTGPWLMFVFLGLGLGAAFRNLGLLLRRIKAQDSRIR